MNIYMRYFTCPFIIFMLHILEVKLQNQEKQKQATVDNFQLHINIISKLSAFM